MLVALSLCGLVIVFLFFFFQAEDGIRDVAVTGVQTCALPISFRRRAGFRHHELRHSHCNNDAGRVGAARACQEQTEGFASGGAWRAGQRNGPRAIALPDLFGKQFRSSSAGGVPGGVEGGTRVAGRGGGPPTSAADSGTGWRILESSVGTGSGRCRLLQPDLVTP